LVLEPAVEGMAEDENDLKFVNGGARRGEVLLRFR